MATTTYVCGDGVWATWNDYTTTTATTSDIWYVWANTGTATATSTTATWTSWCNSTATTTYVTPAQQTPEERAAEEARYQEQVALRKAAEAKAEQLLVENLSLRQREEFLKHGHFIVHGRNARYRVRRGRSANIDVIDRSGKMTHRLCIHPAEPVPDPDTMLAQKLYLENDEDYLLSRANRHTAGFYDRGVQLLEALH